MQRLIYENLRGQRAEFLHAPYIFCQARGLGAPGVKITANSGAYQQGESTVWLKGEARDVKLTFHMLAQSRAELYRLRAELCGLLSPSLAFDGETRARLFYENDHGAWWTWAVPEKGPDWGERAGNALAQVTLDFFCESPYWYGERSMAEFHATKATFRLPMKFPVAFGNRIFEILAQNGGHAPVHPEITLKGCGETPLLVNQSTGARIRLVAPLPQGETLFVRTDPARLSVRITHANGREENAFGLLSPETSLADFTLRPGMNQLIYTPDGDSSRTEIRFEWYDCYEGV